MLSAQNVTSEFFMTSFISSSADSPQPSKLVALPLGANEHLDKTHSVEHVYAILETMQFTLWQRVVINSASLLNPVEFKTGT